MIVASDIIDRAHRVLLDEGGTRWPFREMRLWIIDGVNEIAIVKPSAVAKSTVLLLQPGSYQELDPKYMSVVRFVRNLKSGAQNPRQGGRAIQVVDFDVLNAQAPDWHDTSRIFPRKEVFNVVYDSAAPTVFYVYPPNTGEGVIEAIVSRPPDIPAAKNNGEALADYGINIDLPSVYQSALVDYVLYRSYSKDADFAGSAQRAAAHYAAFLNSLGAKLQNELARSPNSKPPSATEGAA